MLRTICLTLLAGICLLGWAPAQGLSGLRASLRKAETADTGIRVLEKMAKLYEPGAEHAALVTKAVGAALKLPDYEVRIWALGLLQDRLDPEQSMLILGRAATGLRLDWRYFEDAKKGAVVKFPKDLRKLEEYNERLKAHVAVLKHMLAYRAKLIEVLVARQDAGVVDALGEVLDTEPIGADADPVIDGLLQRGTPLALGYVCESIGLLEQALEDGAKRRRAFAKKKAERMPKGYAGSKDYWAARQLRRRTAGLASFDSFEERMQAWEVSLHSRLVAFAEAKDLPAPPETLLPARPWAKWRKAAIKLL